MYTGGTENRTKETLKLGLSRRVSVRPGVPIRRCENGPHSVVHTDGFIQYWPKIIKITCDGLPCSEGKCTPTAISRPIKRRALAYRIVKFPRPDIVILGWRSVLIYNHIGPCTCPGCARFPTFEQCRCEDHCPGFKPDKMYQDSFCFWNETATATPTRPLQYVKGNCECCKVPRICPLNHAFSRSDCECKCIRRVCPRPKFWNQGNCRCECPKIKCPAYHVLDPLSCRCICKRRCPLGTRLDSRTCTCIGECRHFNGNDLCNTVNCSPTRSCKLDRGGNCNCEPVRDCADITDPKQCVNTRCPNQSKFRCQYDARHKCYCLCCYPKTSPPTYNCASLSPLGPARCNSVWVGTRCGWECPLP